MTMPADLQEFTDREWGRLTEACYRIPMDYPALLRAEYVLRDSTEAAPETKLRSRRLLYLMAQRELDPTPVTPELLDKAGFTKDPTPLCDFVYTQEIVVGPEVATLCINGRAKLVTASFIGNNEIAKFAAFNLRGLGFANVTMGRVYTMHRLMNELLYLHHPELIEKAQHPNGT